MTRRRIPDARGVVGRCVDCEREMVSSSRRGLGLPVHSGHGQCQDCRNLANPTRERVRVPLLPPTPEWMRSAPCNQVDPELFYAHEAKERGRVAQAKKVCGRCPYRAACLSWAVKHGEAAGIWGGLTASERRGLTLDALMADEGAA